MNRMLVAVLAAALAAPAAQAQDRLSLGMVLEPPHLDPTAGAAAAIREVTYANIFEGLVRIDAAGQVRPALARDWTVSPDGLTYTFHLQDGVRFHDGAAFDCETVRFSIGRAMAPDSVNAQKGLFAPIARTDCPDPATAVITLHRPTAGFLFGMGWGDAVMVSPGTAAGNKVTPVGTGPFRFQRWVKSDRVELVRNPAYWGTPPRLAAVTFRFISDPAAAAAAVMAGDIDAFPNFPAPETLDRLRADRRFTVVVGTTEGKTLLALNEARKPFDDIRVRRALAHAIDRQALIEGAMSGVGTPIGSHYVPTDPGYVDLTGAYPYDPARARALLAEAGVRPGTTIEIRLPPPAYARRGGEVIAAFLEQVGLTAKLVPVEWAQWLDGVFRKAEYDATIISHTEPRDLDIYARDSYYFNYRSEAYRALFRQYQEAIDPGRQLDLVGQLQRRLSEDQPNVFLFALAKVGVWNAKLRGLWANSPIPANDVTGVSWAE
ncbi:ABC transporter substrate-binding protein [Rhodovastum atsumiense]|uniref:ABC transporter substrate-binding protein n=1 Tax=Rhodovastum atsumiense TaxID=504468 RepID=A0A5M6J1P9_9PROT|nr:ABC transporter substrate-binding protein [Rhodovastum atsumiense]KAA5614149.1 ABC transporter substrate-binding protein [Rhodovastum atsumiense]CAH2599003.1 ABC transporter substrate-binding protein [Rhodovastum atsumiense]